MNRGKGSIARTRIGGQHGYTIVEVLIFLAVSALLFGTTMAMLSGRQSRTQFSNSVRDFETKLLDVANDVANGYYQSPGDIKCTKSGTTVSIQPTTGTLGTNKDCILVGRVVKLGMGPGGGSEKYGIYSLVGLRESTPGKDVAGLGESKPVLLLTSDAAVNKTLVDELNVGYGAAIECVFVGSGSAPAPCPSGNSLAAFVTKLTGGVQSANVGGAITSDVYYHSSAVIDSDGTNLNFQVPEFTKLATGQTLTICIKSGSTNQHALVRITNGRIMSEIVPGGCI